MIITPYGTGRLNPFSPVESAGLFISDLKEDIRSDKRNRNLRPFGRWLKYRHELRNHVDGMTIDRWKAPFELVNFPYGDCEDMAFYWWNSPPVKGSFEPAIYRASDRVLHAVVASESMPNVWHADDEIELYVPSIKEYVRKGDGIGLIDTSWLTGMPHPGGHRLYGSDPSDPKYYKGVSKCTPQSDREFASLEMQFRGGL